MSDKKYLDSLEDLKRVQRELLNVFINFCAEEGLQYFAMFGTMIGAMRHGDIIPWDDDIDLAMPRADYDRLRGLAHKFKEPLFLQTPENDPGACPRYIRLMNIETTFLPQTYPNPMLRGGRLGCGIDILPLDGVLNKAEAVRLAQKAEKCQRIRIKRAALDEMPADEMPDWKRKNCRMLFPRSYAELTARYHKICSRRGEDDSRYYTIAVTEGDHRALAMPRRCFRDYVEMPFGELLIRMPSGYMELAGIIYEGGAETPREGAREPKHFGLVDVNAPYTRHTARYENVFEGAAGKKIILFGAGNMLNIYMERYGRSFRPECTFDNDPKKWGKCFFGVKVLNPKEIHSLLGADTRLIIISVYHREIGRQLEGMGVSDYYVYMDGWKYF